MIIGIPNLKQALLFFFIVFIIFFGGGYLFFSKGATANMNTAIIFFIFIAFIFTFIWLRNLTKGFRFIVIRNFRLTIISLFPVKKIVIELINIESIEWHCVIGGNLDYFRVATIHTLDGGAVSLNDLQLENLDQIFNAIPHGNTAQRTKASIEMAKNERIEALTDLFISSGMTFFFTWLFFFKNEMPNPNNLEFGFMPYSAIPVAVGLLFILRSLNRYLNYKRILKVKPR